MRNLSKNTMQFSGGVALLICLLIGFASPTLTSAESMSNQGLGSAEVNGIKLTINGYSIVNHGQNIRLYYTIHSKSDIQVNPNAKSLMASPHIWVAHTLVRETSDTFKKVGKNEYKGTIEAQLHQYRPEKPHVTFKTDGIFNQNGEWAIDFILNNAEY
ncbi:hypothetical protein B5V88_12460 [Heyndrickxia sporothermodurans]|uniref:Uncharacterized protein n=1 Tax=Heyndrickxia sporothermodurans TaxID=46224 RepID=A0AB37HJ77_9BACI|nr:hypothetical protein [Heyndrickxia sporothermodurans]MBL5768808.1 hypothetical protein [Heyndrickxia sporothermodurans]MBL5772550.1 hypothetical protein [Heyndrickxia sporothermodurans]MBL5776065.1 hypothetical protein [Heyndrickxia sporothermodurans]MBL5779586.1 hypothetical protein [Heyndrickxia sporothermodurans]MBL5783167.1 hypothetical protein [Heyndrickxia sporothermodurans]